ncbi:hypothetical protein RJT34_02083 [Clitoria ternatea]|uniref:B-like cyclin n=1 Tax=Clitoria ternatea TaxID=43366 RepID=A0AAN9Q062_CLITE
MEESIDPATSSLMCLENSDTCFDGFECDVADESPSWDHKNLNFMNQCLIKENHGSELVLGSIVLSDETVLHLVEREREHLPRDDYLRRLRSGDMVLSVRREALDWICKARAYYGFGPYCFCLSVNYLDRFLSLYEAPSSKDWRVQLLAVACLSIAAKMEEPTAPQCEDLQVGEPKFLFEAITIRRMELMILSTLGWKMLSLTPCSFVDYFLRKIICDQLLVKSSILRSLEIILNINRCIDFLEFKPSEIAAAVAISVSRELQAKEVDDSLACFAIVEKERILKCLELVRDFSLIHVSANSASNLVPFSPLSPIGVLDPSCLSSITDELNARSYANYSLDTTITQRQKSG